MSLNIGIGIGIGGRKAGGVWYSKWVGYFQFLWTGTIEDNKLIDVSGNGNDVIISGKDFITDYIPSDSDATFDCPNNATFIACDTDNLWINKNEESRGVEVSELIDYDFERTIVKYDNDSPHHIRAIGILKSDAVLTESQIDELHTDFSLALYWSGVLNENGFIKANRGLAQSVWTAVSAAALDYSDTYETAVLADGGEIINRKILESEYQRLIDTGDILTCWFSYHWQCGIKRGDVDYGANGVHNMVSKWYNLSPVAGRFAESVVPYSIVAGTDARPEYTSSGLLFRPTNLDSGIKCGLETVNSTVLTNVNNKVRLRAIYNPAAGGYVFLRKGYVSDDGETYLKDVTTTRKLLMSFRETGITREIASTENDVFANGTEVIIESTLDYTAKTIDYKKNGVALTQQNIAVYTPIYPAQSYPDVIGCARNLGRTPASGYIKQVEIFYL